MQAAGPHNVEVLVTVAMCFWLCWLWAVMFQKQLRARRLTILSILVLMLLLSMGLAFGRLTRG